MNNNLISVSKVSKIYTGGYVAFNYINFDISKGATTGVVGKSKDGKSTLLMMLAGLEGYQGSILADGKELREYSLKELNIGYLASDLGLFNNKSIKANLTFPLKIRKYSKADIDCRLSKFSDLTGISLDIKVKDLVYVDKLRLALYRLTYVERRYIIIDNVFDTLDSKEFDLIVAYFQMLRGKGNTFILASDSIEIINKFNVDNFALIGYNSIIDYGSLNMIKCRPSTVASCKLLDSNYIFLIGYIDNGFINIGNYRINFERRLVNNVFSKIVIATTEYNITSAGHIVGKVVECYDNTIIISFDEDNEIRVNNTNNYNIGDTLSIDINLDNCHVYDFGSERIIEV